MEEQYNLWEKLEQTQQEVAIDFGGDWFSEKRDEYMNRVYAEASNWW